MSKYLRPGVFAKETDLSQIISAAGNAVGAVVGSSPRGPVNKRTFISNTKDFVTLFGEPDTNFGYMQHTAVAFLEQSNSLYVTRVVNTDAKHSAIKVQKATPLSVSAEALGTSDNDDVTFAKTLANLGSGIVPGSVVVLVEGQDSTIGTDSDGVISGTGIASGTINYATGAISVTTSVTPGNNKHVTVSYQYKLALTKAVSGGLTVTALSGDLFSADTDGILLFRAENPGVWGNTIKFTLDNLVGDFFDIKVYEVIDGIEILRESFPGCSRKQGIDGYGSSYYVEDKINDKSIFIAVKDNTALADTVLPQEIETTTYLASGANGAAVTESIVSIGWDLYANPDEVTVGILMNAGYVTASTFAVQTKMKSIAESRRDCVAILDAPFASLAASSLVTWRKSTQNFNSSFCGLYAPWVEVNNSFNNKKITIPPSGFVGQAIAKTDRVAFPWTPAAGLNRAIIDSGILNVTKLSNSYDAGDQELLYPANINFLLSKPGNGIAIWGQKTQQTKLSALDRLNVRRLLITIEVNVKKALDYVVFELNDEFTRSQVSEAISNFMDQIQAQSGVSAYQVVCDDSNNTSTVIDQNQMNVDIYIQPTRAAEFIQLQTVVTRTGVNFSDLIAQGGNF